MVSRKMSGRHSDARGFTLLELLVVVSIIVILAGLLIPAFYKVRNGVREKKAAIETRIIGAAIAAYKLQTREFPAPVSDLAGGVDVTYTDDNDQVMELLRDADPQVLDENKLRWDGNVVLDPWENSYRIALDGDHSGGMKLARLGNEKVWQSVAVWSAGKDEVDDTDDDIRSWQKEK